MKRSLRYAISFLLFLAFSTAGAEGAATPAIDEAAQQALKEMSRFLAAQKAFSFDAYTLREEVQAEGFTVEQEGRVTVSVERPNRLRARVTGDVPHRSAIYDGAVFTMVESAESVYAQVAVDKDLDGLLDHMASEYGVVWPLADFVFSDPYAVLTQRIARGWYLGKHGVRGTLCHHLGFQQPGIEWQIWIEAGEQPLPRKLVIRYKDHPGAPRFVARIEGWKLDETFPPDTFRLGQTDGLEKIPFVSKAAGAE